MKFKRIIFATAVFLCLFSVKAILARDYTVVIDSNGTIKGDPDSIYDKLVQANIKFEKGDRIIVEIINDPLRPYKYLYKIVKSRIEYEVIPVFTGKTEEKFLMPAKEGKEKIVINLDRSGTRYNVAITRYTEKDFEERKKGVSISAFTCTTSIVYYLGAHVGFFIPLMRANFYSVKPLPGEPPFTGSYGLLTKKSIKEYNAVFIGSIYPFGFKPDMLFPSNYSYNFNDYFRVLFKNIHTLIHVDLAFELSKNIFSKLYFGGGLCFGLFSVSFLARYAKVDDIGLHLGNNQVVPAVLLIASPVRERYRWSYGISVSLPLDFAFTWIGNALK